jgi:hypothetical protein
VCHRTEHGLAAALRRHAQPTPADFLRLAGADLPAWHGGADPVRRDWHSPNTPGCTCRDQWVCPACGHWHRHGVQAAGTLSAADAAAVVAAGEGARIAGAAEAAVARAAGDAAAADAAELGALLRPVLLELAQSKPGARHGGHGSAREFVGQEKTAREPVPPPPPPAESMAGLVCHGCATSYPALPFSPTCPFRAREDYHRAVGVRAGPGLGAGGAGGLGNDVVIKVQVRDDARLEWGAATP